MTERRITPGKPATFAKAGKSDGSWDVVDNYGKPKPIVGFLTMKVMTVIKEPVVDDPSVTVGQMIDKQIDGWRNEAAHAQENGIPAPVMHSITFDFLDPS